MIGRRAITEVRDLLARLREDSRRTASEPRPAVSWRRPSIVSAAPETHRRRQHNIRTTAQRIYLGNPSDDEVTYLCVVPVLVSGESRQEKRDKASARYLVRTARTEMSLFTRSTVPATAEMTSSLST
jgi:hypothetical protein